MAPTGSARKAGVTLALSLLVTEREIGGVTAMAVAPASSTVVSAISRLCSLEAYDRLVPLS